MTTGKHRHPDGAAAEEILGRVLASGDQRPELYRLYRELRELAPIYRSDQLDSWVVTSHALANDLLRRKDAISDTKAAEAFRGGADGPWFDVWSQMMLYLDPEAHDRVRRMVNRAFSPRAAERLRPVSQAVVDGLIDAVEGRGQMDLVADFAHQLPMTVIAELCALDRADVPQLLQWAHDFARRADMAGLDSDIIAKGDAAAESFVAYFGRLIEERRADRGDDLLSIVARADDDGDRLDDAELIASSILLFMAGHETTKSLIGNGFYALAHNLDQMAALRSQPSLAKSAVEEILRYDTSVQANFRVLADGDHGLGIPPGDRVMVVIGAANRDPERFPDPDRFDIARDDSGHLSFGFGAYYCVGAALARVEVQVALVSLLTRLPDIQLTQEPIWNPIWLSHGAQSMPVAW